MSVLLALALVAADPQTAQIENAIRAELKDPDSAKFAWPNGFVSGTWENLYGKRFTGQITCGTINAKNGYGGYNGAEALVGIIAADGSVTFETDDSYQGTVNHNYVSGQCRKLGLPVD